MKTFVSISIFLLSAILFFSCSTSPQEKAEAAIKEYLSKNLNDAKSYESVEFGKLDSVFTSCEDLQDYKDTMALHKEAEVFIPQSKEKIKSLIDENKALSSTFEFKESISKMKAIIREMEIRDSMAVAYLENIKHNFKPEFVGFDLVHKYRAKNAMGALILKTDTFKFDKNLIVTN